VYADLCGQSVSQPVRVDGYQKEACESCPADIHKKLIVRLSATAETKHGVVRP